LLFSILAPFLFVGISKGVLLHKEWFSAMQEHSNYLSSAHTIQSLIQFYLYNATHLSIFIISVVCIAYIASVFYERRKSESALLPASRFINDYFIFIAIIPNLLITDTEHFLFSIPLLLIVLNYLSIKGKPVLILLFILIVFLYGGNSTDLLGNNLSDKFEKYGMLGIGNLGIILFTIYVYFQGKKKAIREIDLN
jgi:hypothetical protein